MAHHRNFDIEMTIVPDAAGQYEAAFTVHDTKDGRYKFPPVGSYLTPDDAREQTSAWARKWIDANFPEPGEGAMEEASAVERDNAKGEGAKGEGAKGEGAKGEGAKGENAQRENAQGDRHGRP